MALTMSHDETVWMDRNHALSSGLRRPTLRKRGVDRRSQVGGGNLRDGSERVRECALDLGVRCVSSHHLRQFVR